MRMELPPGWRGYGAKDYVPHPDVARRTAEIEAARSRFTGADHFELQKALMPYDHLLPPHLRARNRRIEGTVT